MANAAGFNADPRRVAVGGKRGADGAPAPVVRPASLQGHAPSARGRVRRDTAHGLAERADATWEGLATAMQHGFTAARQRLATTAHPHLREAA
jgi:hypothetical protein